MVAHLTPDERIARGRAARAKVPRSSHGVFAPSASRPDSVALLEKQAATRLPELVAIRHGRMLVSPLTFFRGAALLMAPALGSLPIAGIRTPGCAHAPLSTFSAYASPERRMILDVTAFVHPLACPEDWDCTRL